MTSGGGSRPAATVVILRPGPAGVEVLLTTRPASMRFGGGLSVFPGGRLEPGEDHRAAAVRETLEEVGIELGGAGLVPLTRWVTPSSLPIRFDARFFGAIVDPGTEIGEASEEVVEAAWVRPIVALEAMLAGTRRMWQPTVVTLQQLEGLPRDLDAGQLARAFAPDGDGVGDAPQSDVADAGGIVGREFATRWAGGIEGRRGMTMVLGTKRWLVVDPPDPTEETFDAILGAADAADATVVGVLVTSLRPERHAGVEQFATGLDLPVAGPPGSTGLVPYAITELRDADTVPFGDSPARVSVMPSRGRSRWSDRASRLRLG